MKKISANAKYTAPINDVADAFMPIVGMSAPGNSTITIQSMRIHNAQEPEIPFTVQVIKRSPKVAGSFVLIDLSLDAGDIVNDDTIYELTESESLFFFSDSSDTTIIVSAIQNDARNN